MSRKEKRAAMTKTRHSSLDMLDPEVVVKDQKKKQDVLSKARNKLHTFSDVWNWNRQDVDGAKKSRTQATLDYFFRPCPNNKEKHMFTNNSRERRASSLQKQHSVDSYPLKISLGENGEHLRNSLSRDRPATISTEKINGECRETAALALERPRKKLSFKEPEIMGYPIQVTKQPLLKKNSPKKSTDARDFQRSVSVNATLRKANSWDDMDLEVVGIFIDAGALQFYATYKLRNAFCRLICFYL